MQDDRIIQALAQFAEEFGAKSPLQVASIMVKGALAGRDWTDIAETVRRNAPDLFYDRPQKTKRPAPRTRHRQR